MVIKHAFQTLLADNPNYDVSASEWNDAHTIEPNTVVDAHIGAHTSTKITITAKGQLNASIVYIDQANSFGDFAQTFKDNQLKINNPLDTFAYTLVAGAIAAARNLNLPVLTADDTIATQAFAQALTNKIIDADLNTITNIEDADIKAHTSTKITITAKGQLNSAIVYNDQANTFGAFVQTFTQDINVGNTIDRLIDIKGGGDPNTRILRLQGSSGGAGNRGLIQELGNALSILTDSTTYNSGTERLRINFGAAQGSAGITSFESISPNADNTLDLGTSALSWRDIHTFNIKVRSLGKIFFTGLGNTQIADLGFMSVIVERTGGTPLEWKMRKFGAGVGFGFELYTNDSLDVDTLRVTISAKEDIAEMKLFSCNFVINDARNIILGTTTGTKIGTATTQKLGFYNATPVVQTAGIVDADGTLSDVTNKFNSLLAKLETYGLLAVA